MKTLDEVADMLSKEGRGFAVVQYESKDGKGAQYRYKAEDIETMLGFLIMIVDSICNEFVEKNGYLVHESIRQTVEKTMQMNDKRPSDKLFEKTVKRLREIFAKYKFEPEEDNEEDNPPLTWDELQQMEGKPVWVERPEWKEWLLVSEIDEDKCEIYLRDKWGNGVSVNGRNIGYWRAYRKERSE